MPSRRSVVERVPLQVPAPFDYERATSVEHAIALLEELGPSARLLAGGHSLLPMMKLRLAVPDHVIDIDPLAGQLGYVREHDGEMRIGAMTRHRDLLESELLDRRLAIFTDAERVIADPVVRSRGTIGGALCQADPSEDLSAVCAAVGARMVIRGSRGERVIGMREFHRGPYQTAVEPAEMLVEIRVPLRDGSGSAYEKVDRRVGDWAVVAAGASVELAGATIVRAGIALAAAGGDITAADAEAALAGGTPSDELFAHAAALAAGACDPVTDQRGSADYKRHVAGVLTERVLRRATARALGEARDAKFQRADAPVRR
jgi:aerobic carbon-monoxide dehydrogenase medium subunit